MPLYKGKQVDLRPPTKDDEGYDAEKRQVVVVYQDGTTEVVDASEFEPDPETGEQAGSA